MEQEARISAGETTRQVSRFVSQKTSQCTTTTFKSEWSTRYFVTDPTRASSHHFFEWCATMSISASTSVARRLTMSAIGSQFVSRIASSSIGWGNGVMSTPPSASSPASEPQQTPRTPVGRLVVLYVLSNRVMK